METQERYFHLEYFLTFFLFLPLLFLFPEEAAPLRIFLVGGIILGSAVAYISRNQFYSFRRFATLSASLLILSGTVYFVLKSSFLYREVIVICIKSLSLLIVANSFSSCLQGYLNSMQIFSILLFFCICALTKGYSNLFLILAAGFAFNLFAITRIKFYILFNNAKKAREKFQGINMIFIIIILLSALLAWALFINLPLGKVKTWEYLKEEDLITTQEKEEGKGSSLSEEQLQKELTQLAFKLSSTDEMHRVIEAMQDLLIKDKPFAYEVNKAQKDILEIISSPDLAQEAQETEKLRGSIKAYVGKKISNNLVLIKNNINKVIEDNRIGLWQRFAILSAVNKLEYSNSLEGLDKYSEQLQSAVNDESISDEARRQLKQLNNQLREWKAYQTYSKKLDSFQEEINALDENKKQDFNELAQQIRDVNTVSDSRKVDRLVERMRQVSFSEDDKLIDQAQELLKLKKIMLASKEISQLRKKLEEAGQSVDRPPELADALNAVEESREAQEILKKISQLLERLRQDNYFKIPQEAKEILEESVENLIKESVGAFKKKIQESNLPDSGESLLEGLSKMDSGRAEEDITTASAQMQKTVEAFYRQGSITQETRDSFIKETKSIEQLYVVRLGLANIGKQERPVDKDASLDYKEKVANLLQELSVEDEQKERIKKLMHQLDAAQTVSQVEDVLEVINQEMEELAKKENARKIEEIKNIIQAAAEVKKMFILEKDSRNLRKEIEDLKGALPQQAVLLENKLDKLRESKNDQDLLKSATALKELSESKEFENKFKKDESLEVSGNGQQPGGLEIELLPSYAVLPLKTNVTFQSVAIYDNFVKDITPELEWFSSNPSVAFVNPLGLVYANGLGEAEITCRYRGKVSRKSRVTVVEMIPEIESVFITN
jgi:hypothetical protein